MKYKLITLFIISLLIPLIISIILTPILDTLFNEIPSITNYIFVYIIIIIQEYTLIYIIIDYQNNRK